MDRKRQKKELYGLIGFYVGFVIALLAIDIFYSAWAQMPWWCVLLAIVAHVGVIGSTTVLLKEWEDPNFDYVRKFFFAFWLAAVAFVAGFRVAKNESKMFQDGVDKNKKENTINENRGKTLSEILNAKDTFFFASTDRIFGPPANAVAERYFKSDNYGRERLQVYPSFEMEQGSYTICNDDSIVYNLLDSAFTINQVNDAGCVWYGDTLRVKVDGQVIDSI